MAVCVFALTSLVAFGQAPFDRNTSPLPAPTGFVNDYAGVIPAADKQALENRLKRFKDEYGVELAVAVVDTTGERDIFDYSLAVARGWGIGSPDDDNPAGLLFIAIKDRKYFTHISKDLEDELPDGVVGSLQREFLVPEFRRMNYSKGIKDTVEAYITRVEFIRTGEGIDPAKPTAAPSSRDSDEFGFSSFCCLAIILFVLLVIMSYRGGGRKSKDDDDRWGGGFGGGGGSILPWIILGGLSGGSSGGSSSWGGGSDWGGGGGGSDWGGFGGGGDFGGGGGGGGW